MKIAFISNCNTIVHPFDILYLKKVSTNISYFNYDIKELSNVIRDIILNNDFDVYVLKDFSKLRRDLIVELKTILDDIVNETNVNILIVDTFYPAVEQTRDYEIFKRKNITFLSDYALNEFENSIEIPMLSILNFDIHHMNNFQGRPHFKKFVMFHNLEFSNRKFDVMCRMGKPKEIRLLISLLLLKHNVNNSYINVSYSQETSISNYEEGISSLTSAGFDELIEKYNLHDIKNDLKIESYLGSMYNIDELKFKNVSKQMGLDYTVDFNSCAEIYTESITNELKNINQYPKLVAFTEKTFAPFFDFKIPLPVDSLSNIKYLENLGFKFPITPCYIEQNDTLDTIYQKLNEWIIELKKYDLRKLWNEWVFCPPFESPLHENHNLVCEFMQKQNTQTKDMESKPQYIATYKFIEKFFPNFLEDYKKWDYQTYLFLKDKKLI